MCDGGSSWSLRVCNIGFAKHCARFPYFGFSSLAFAEVFFFFFFFSSSARQVCLRRTSCLSLKHDLLEVLLRPSYMIYSQIKQDFCTIHAHGLYSENSFY